MIFDAADGHRVVLAAIGRERRLGLLNSYTPQPMIP